MRILKKGLIYFLSITILWVLVYRLINPPITLLMIQRCFERKLDGKTLKLKKKWCSYDKLPNNLKKQLLLVRMLVFHHIGALILTQSNEHIRKTSKEKKYMGVVRLVNKRQRMFFYGPDAPGFGKGSRYTLLS